MEAGVALLLPGVSADLSALVHAVALARRTTKILHVVCKTERKSPAARQMQEQFVALTTRLGNQDGIRVYTHLLERLTGEPLLRFLCAYQIFCLVLGVKNRKEAERKAVWVNLLRKQLQTSENWYLSDLWSAIIIPWDAVTLERAIFEINSRSLDVRQREFSSAEDERPDIFATVLLSNKNE